MVSFTTMPFYHWGESALYQLKRRSDGPHCPSERLERNEISFCARNRITLPLYVPLPVHYDVNFEAITNLMHRISFFT